MARSWAARWQDLLVFDDPGTAREVAQGRAYYRSGRVTDLRVTTGGLVGRVQGHRATPRAVEVSVAVLDEQRWQHVIGLLARQLRHSTRLLAGLEPEGLEDELAAAGVRLFPEPSEITIACGCGHAQPCAHAAAVWQAATDRIDEDPFVLLRLRGRGRERLLADLAAGRTQGGGDGSWLPLHGLEADGWPRARSPLEELALPAEDDPPAAASPLRLLGNPPGWPAGPDAQGMFGPLVERAAAWARALEAHDGEAHDGEAHDGEAHDGEADDGGSGGD